MRKAVIKRDTKETQIEVSMDIDGEGKALIDTKIGFFNHMLEALAKHSLIDINLKAVGDLDVDTHHTVEDTAIVLGKAFKEAIGDKKGIERYASHNMCMDEALILGSVDLCGRGYFMMDYRFKTPKCGDFETETVEEFFRSFALNAELNLHFVVQRGENAHHIIEAMFKCLAKMLRDASSYNPRIKGVFSTKGSL